MNKKSSNTLYCFTPPVSLATFIIEGVFALYLLFRYKRDSFVWGTAILLMLLGIFQLSEFALCTGGDMWWWVRIGHIAITFLPPVGLHLTRLQTKTRDRIALIAAYGAATIFSVCYIVLPDLLSIVTCTGRFVAFHSEGMFNMFYGTYYLGLLAWAMIELVCGIRKKSDNKMVLAWMLTGYASFLVPTGIITILITQARIGIPSIMCGFALLLAVIVVLAVMPEYEKIRLGRRNR